VVCDQPVSGRGELVDDRLLRRLVSEGMREPGLPVQIQDRDARAGREVVAELREVIAALREVMIGVAGEDEIDAAVGQARIVGLGADHLDVGAALRSRATAQVLDHVVVDVHGVHASRGSDGIGEPEGEVATAGAEIGDFVAGRHIEQRDDRVRLLPRVAADPLVREAFPGAAAEAGRENGERRECADPHANSPGGRDVCTRSIRMRVETARWSELQSTGVPMVEHG
jgi:hypothetical protein